MSTRPGPDSFHDAGLDGEGLDEPINLRPETQGSEPRDSGEDYHPLAARPDLDDRADEADVAEQAIVVPSGEEEEPA